MRFGVFVGCVGIVFCATMADASEVRACTYDEVQEASRNQSVFLRSGVMLGTDCVVTAASVVDPSSAERGGGRRSSDRRGSNAERGIDRSNEPCWIDYPQRGDPDYGQPMIEGVHFGYCPDRVPRMPRPTWSPSPRPSPTAPSVRWPPRDPFETTLDEETAYWRRVLLQTLPEGTDMLGNPFRPSTGWRQAPWGPGSQQRIAPPRRAVATPDRSGGNSELRLTLPRDGYVAAPSWPIYQPRVPPANIFVPPGSRGGNSGGCNMHPSAAC